MRATDCFSCMCVFFRRVFEKLLTVVSSGKESFHFKFLLFVNWMPWTVYLKYLI